MLNHGAYLEQVPIQALMHDLSVAINATKQYKPRVDADSLQNLWCMKSFDGFRNRIQYLVRRKRGQWAAIIKKEFTKLFLPSVPIKPRPSKRVDTDMELIDVDDDDEDVYEESSALSREETFRIGLLFMTDRVRSANGTNQLRLNSTARYVATVLLPSMPLTLICSETQPWTGPAAICTCILSAKWPTRLKYL